MVILLSGPDTFRSQRRYEQLRDAFRAKHDQSGLNTILLDGATVTAEEVRGALATQGFFSNKRFVGLNRWSQKSSVPVETLTGILKSFTDSPDVITVIRIDQTTSPSGRKPRGPKTSSGLKLTGAKNEIFETLTPAEITRWITAEVKRRDGKIEAGAANEISIRAGSDLWRIDHEIDKLIAYAAGRMIVVADVATHVPAPEVTDMFAMADAVGHRRRALALRLLERELAAGTHPLAIVSQLANHLHTLRAVQRQSVHLAPTAIATHLALHPFVVKKALEQSRSFQPEQLARWHHRLVDIDATLKQSTLDPATLLDVLLVGD